MSFTGATGRLFDQRSRFFISYKDEPVKFLKNTASIITAPFIFADYALACLIKAAGCVLFAIGYLITFNFEKAGNFAFLSLDYIGQCAKFTVAAIISPLVNLIDVIGSTIATMNDVVNSGSNAQCVV